MTTAPAWLEGVLPGHTAEAWEALADILTPDAYLGGGTGIAVHLQHRASRDLDVFFEEPLALDDMERALQERGPTFTTRKGDGTLDCVFGATKLQLLDASHYRLIEIAERVAGIRVAGLGDLMGMKLRAITDRGEHRDYLDLAAIELDGGRRAEEGLAYFLARFAPENPDDAVATVLRSLAYLGDLEDDPALAVTIEELQEYWTGRARQVSSQLSRYGYRQVDPVADAQSGAATVVQLAALARVTSPGAIGPHLPVNGKCKVRTTKRRRCPFDALPGRDICGVHRHARNRR